MKQNIFLVAFFAPFLTFAQINNVTVDEAQDLIKEEVVFLDVRENNEVEKLAYQVEGLVHVPLSEIEERYKEIPTDQKVIVACRSGKRSMKAIDILQEKGYSNLVNLEGGINTWQGKGYPVIIDGVAPPQKTCSKSGGEGKASGKACCSKTEMKKCNKNKSSSCCSKKSS